MIKRMAALGGVLAASLFWMSNGFAAGVWDDNVVLLGVNGNGSYGIAARDRIYATAYLPIAADSSRVRSIIRTNFNLPNWVAGNGSPCDLRA